MKNFAKLIMPLVILLSFSTTGYALDEKMDMKKHHAMKGMGGGMGMMNMTEEQKEQHMRAMQEHMLSMHDLSNRILAEKNPETQKKPKEEQLQLMKVHHQKMMHMMMEHKQSAKQPAASK